MADKMVETILQGLKAALAEPGDVRLYKSGKLPGLFAGRAGINGDAAAQAIRDGLLEVVRTETKGKISIEWVRATPSAVRYVHEQESPLTALADLRNTLAASQGALPAWLAHMQDKLNILERSLREDAQRFVNLLQALTKRVDKALAHLQGLAVQVPDSLAVEHPWAIAAVQYLTERKKVGATTQCPLPELFKALTNQQPDLTLPGFHAGLRRLQERKVLQLFPHDGPESLPQPEFALLDGESVYYYAGS
jgi:hypothetical protein